MDIIKVEASLDTPRVIYDIEKQKFEISGKSFPADVAEFYKPVLEWLEKYCKNPGKRTFFDLKLDYFNTATSKVLLDMLYKFEEVNSGGNQVVVRWFYPDDDEDMEETGVEYSKIVALPFEHISYSVQVK